jgi:polysaccharide biosynthesis/export protein
MKTSVKFIFLLLCLITAFSCTPQRKLVYFRKIQPGIYETGKQPEYKLQPGDLISINVYSANDKAAQLFSANRSINTNVSNEISTYLYGFIVSDSGDVNIPLAGKIYVAGHTLDSAAYKIDNTIKEFFFDAVVDVKLMSFQITVIGEVSNPGTYKVFKPKLNILEAIALAGDLNVYGKREVFLLRETQNGLEVTKIDLNDKKFLKSDHFYLLPSDIVYVEPHKAKSFGANTIPNVFSTILSTLSIVLIIVNLNR